MHFFRLVFVLLLVSFSDHKVGVVGSDPETIQLGLIFPITYGGPGSVTGGETLANIAHAAIVAINESNFIPNHQIALQMLDTQGYPAKAVKAAIDCALTYHCVGVLGERTSDFSELVQDVLQNYNIPQISAFSTASYFSQEAPYPTFMRTIPADDAAAPIIAQVLLRYGWMRVGVVVGSGGYGASMYTAFEAAAEKYDIEIAVICVLQQISPEYDIQAKKLKDGYVQIILAFAQQAELEGMLNAAHNHSILGESFVWIGGDTLPSINSSALPDGTLLGTLAVIPSSVADNYSTQANAYFDLLLRNHLVDVPYGGFLYDAAYIYAYAFKTLVNTNTSWTNLTVLMDALLAVNFTGVSGQVSFGYNGNRQGATYSLLNWNKNSTWQTVATIADGNMSDIGNIMWSDGSSGTGHVPPDYIRLFPPAIKSEVSITFYVLAVVSLIITFVLFVCALAKSEPITKMKEKDRNKFGFMVLSFFGGLMGCIAVIVFTSGVSTRNCTVMVCLGDLSVLLSAAMLWCATIPDVIHYLKTNFLFAKYKKFKERCITGVGLWWFLVSVLLAFFVVDIILLVPTGIDTSRSTSLWNLVGNTFEQHCNFTRYAAGLLVLLVTMSAVTTILVVCKLFLNRNKMPPVSDFFLAIACLANFVVFAVGASTQLKSPSQQTIVIWICAEILTANLITIAQILSWLPLPVLSCSFTSTTDGNAKKATTTTQGSINAQTEESPRESSPLHGEVHAPR